ncbi:hypothetical protein F4780DRAFT_747195 [Xylariomycetidae sp. FL0641]|nr:hypothetical protein F4780DRAFT_747195 [Xylariomycetidae sp. FL0641]
MCSGQPNALPNTHSQLTASFIIPSTGAVSLLLPTSTDLSSTATMKSSSTVTPTFAPTTMTSSLVTVPPASTSFMSQSTTTTTTAAAHPTQSNGSDSASASSVTLNTAQIVGISIGGVAGAIFLALAAIMIARCIRRRKYPDSERDFYQMSEHRNSQAPFGSRVSQIMNISRPIFRTSKYRPELKERFPAAPPIPYNPVTNYPTPPIPNNSRTNYTTPPMPSNPRMNNNQATNVDRDTIGLAISRPRSLIPPRASIKSPKAPMPPVMSPAMSPPRTPENRSERRLSRLLPPRPALTLNIPPRRSSTRAPSSQVAPTTGRDSGMTNMTAFADLDTEAQEGGQIWRPPPSDPQSANTVYVADRWGNWVLSSNNGQPQTARAGEIAELDTYTPLTKSPIEKQEEAARMAAAISASSPPPKAPPPAFLSEPTDPGFDRSSSLYSQASAVRQNSRGAAVSSRGNTGSFSSRSRKRSIPQLDRSDSKASATTINTSSTGPFDDEYESDHDIARLSHLSPVMESPPLGSGSQIRYPRIPGRLDGATIRLVPPPKRPNFMGGSPPGQPSPTLGTLMPLRDSPGAYPAPLNPRRSQRPLLVNESTRSGFTPEPPNDEVFPMQNEARSNRMRTPPIQRMQRSGNSPYQPGAVGFPMSQQSRQAGRNLVRTPPESSRGGFSPSPPSDSSYTAVATPPRLGIDTQVQDSKLNSETRPHIALQQSISPMSSGAVSVSSTTSSLLAKRLGSDRAAALALDPNNKAKARQQWMRQDGGLLSPDAAGLASARGRGPGTLPRTPTWQPKLTPTRRGEDLFLNVQ